jgi:cytoskeletal protein RodZ
VFEIGATLREARVRRRLTLQQVEEDTKIRVKYVQAMENEDFEVMPGPTYVKGFLRSYAAYLGLDARIILDEYRSRVEPNVQPHEPFGGTSALGRPHAHRRRNTLAFVAVVCLLLLAIVAILGINNHPASTPSTSRPSASATKSPKPSHKPSPARQTALRVSVTGGDSLIELRMGSATASPVYDKMVLADHNKVFHSGRLLFLMVGDPSVVTVSVNGKAEQRLTGTAPTTYRVLTNRVVRL